MFGLHEKTLKTEIPIIFTESTSLEDPKAVETSEKIVIALTNWSFAIF